MSVAVGETNGCHEERILIADFWILRLRYFVIYLHARGEEISKSPNQQSDISSLIADPGIAVFCDLSACMR
jgi:hypothetical protein